MNINEESDLHKIKTYFHNLLIYSLIIIKNDLNFSMCYDFNQYFCSHLPGDKKHND